MSMGDAMYNVKPLRALWQAGLLEHLQTACHASQAKEYERHASQAYLTSGAALRHADLAGIDSDAFKARISELRREGWRVDRRIFNKTGTL